MYLHLGQDVVVKSSKIMGIFDIDNTTIKKSTRNYIYTAEKKGKIETISSDLPKSFIVMTDGKVYISPISPRTLFKRKDSIGSFFRRSFDESETV